MDRDVLRFRSRGQLGQARSKLRPLAVYKPSFSLNNNNNNNNCQDDEGQALLGPAR